MQTDQTTTEKYTLRGNAEKTIELKATYTAQDIADMSHETVANLIHALQVHQIELKMQNDELCRVHGELEYTKDKYSHLYDVAPIGYITMTGKGIVDESNLTMASMLGVVRTDLIGKRFTQFIHKEDQDIFYKHRVALLETKTPQSCELRLVKKDSQQMYTLLEAIIVTDEKNQDQIRVTISNISEHKRFEDEIYKQKHLFETMFNTIPDGIVITDTQRVIQLANKGMESTFGYKPEELLGKSTRMVYADLNNFQKIGETVFSEKAKKSENLYITRYKDSSGREFPGETFGAKLFDENNKWVGNLGIMRDVTERERHEKELGQAQRMESIGTLAGGIAHDFNNILFPIVGHTEMLLEDVSKDSPLRDSLNEIYTGSLRARALVQRILAFSHQGKSELTLMKIQIIIKEALKLIRSTIPTTISIHQNLQPECGAVNADPTQIHQIVMNLTTNAYHAMEENGGELNVVLEEIELGRHEVIPSDMAPGPYACLTVTDTGKGMNKDVKDKAFEPFFTTKEKGKGTGMGLSVVHGIVKSMNGAIQVHSEPGCGTEFQIFLPIVKNAFEKQENLAKEPLIGGSESVLLVDDEKSIIAMGRQALDRLGYQVTTRRSGIEALKVFRANPDKFDLVITDMAMPKMSGDKLAIELIKIKSDIPILLCTGFSESMSEEKILSIGIKGFLLKPIIMQDLSQKMREILDKSENENTK